MADIGPKLGELIEGEPGRDAVHIAIAPVMAGEALVPGQRVRLSDNGRAYIALWGKEVGIVDPYLSNIVGAGERFYLFLMPNTVTSLRHVWTHPAFPAKLPRSATHAE